MHNRTCSNCKNALGEFDHYFCSLCGNKLSKEEILEFGGVRVRTFKLSSVTRSTLSDIFSIFKSIKVYYIFALLIFIGFIIYGITQTGLVEFANYELSKTTESEVKLPPRLKTPEITFDIASADGKFTTTKFAELIPAKASLYFEGTDISLIAKYLIRDENLIPLLKKPTILLDSGYAGFYLDGNWGYILLPKDVDIIQTVMKDVKDPYWHFKIIKDKFVMVSNPKVFEQIAEIEKGTAPSLALNSDFVKKDQLLKTEGRGKMIFMDKKAFTVVRNSLGGLDQTTIGNINKVLEAGFDSIVIN